MMNIGTKFKPNNALRALLGLILFLYSDNIENAKRWVNSLTSGGGTALYDGVYNSVQRPLDMERANLAFIISDGYPTSGITRWSAIQANILAATSSMLGLC